MKGQRIDIASIRRDQIVEAAVAVITEQGLQNLSLSDIEKKAGMSRGFPGPRWWEASRAPLASCTFTKAACC